MNLQRAAVCVLLSATLVSADTLLLRSGTRVEGSFIGGDARSVRFAQGSEVRTYNLTDITSILFSGTGADNQSQSAAPPPPAPIAPPPPPPSAAPAAVASAPVANGPVAPAPPSNVPAGFEVPPGTQIVVRLIDPVDSDTDHLGQTYRVSIDQPVMVNGQVAIPTGADAIAKLVDAQHSGRIEGRTVMTLDLRSVTVNGRPYDVLTTGVPTASNSRGARSAKVIGGTAALGAIIGGIGGGGRGAGIGTLAGAGAGTAAEIATSGQKVKIPSESRLTFTLQNPLQL